jgi:hypothetical protein
MEMGPIRARCASCYTHKKIACEAMGPSPGAHEMRNGLLCVVAFSLTSWADDIIYANNFDGGTDNIWQIDLTTGNTITNQFAVPVSTQGGFNGRGGM